MSSMADQKPKRKIMKTIQAVLFGCATSVFGIGVIMFTLGLACFGLISLFFILIGHFTTIPITRPFSPFIHVTQASLNEFSLTSDGHTLHYGLDLNITARNPNVNYDVHYDDLQVKAYWSSESTTYYGDGSKFDQGSHEFVMKKMFAAADVNSFYQGKGGITTLPPISLKGSSSMLAHVSNPKNLGRRRLLGNKFRRLRSPETWVGCWIPRWKQESTFSCDLMVPLINGELSASSTTAFRATQCYRCHGAC
ncbi:hypothetical protein ACLB2K_064686 [Fragaria x ananassa]